VPRTLALTAAGAFLIAAGCSSHASSAGDDAGDSGGQDAGLEAGPAFPCNGHDALCPRRFDEVAYPCTHNAYSATEYGFDAPYVNQQNGLGKQLDDGIRCMMLDIYDNAGEHDLCHVTCALAKKPHVEALGIIKQFMDAHPREVLTLDYEDYVAVQPPIAERR
jgi:hypothetical protein